MSNIQETKHHSQRVGVVTSSNETEVSRMPNVSYGQGRYVNSLTTMSNIQETDIANTMVQMAQPESIVRERKIFARLIHDKTYNQLLYTCRKMIDDGLESTASYRKAKQALSDYCDKAFAK